MKERKITLLTILFVIAVIVAFTVRFIGLGAPTLTESEAQLALQAQENTGKTQVNRIEQPLYINFTGDIFWLFSTNNFAARAVSAIAGSLLCLAPILIKKRIGRVEAVIFSFLLALEPSLVAASRQAGSSILAICTISFSIIFIWRKKSILAGILCGISLLCGPAAWQGWIIVGLTVGIFQLIKWSKTWKNSNPDANGIEKGQSDPSEFQYPKFIMALAGTLLLVGTNFFTRIGNLSGLFGGLIGYFQGWTSHSATWLQSLGLLSVSALTFGIFVIIFGIAGTVKGFIENEKTVELLAVNFFVALVLEILFPLHTPLDVAWLLIPLTLISAVTLPKIFTFTKKDAVVQASVTVIFFALLIFAWLNAIWILQNFQNDPTNSKIHLAASIGALILLVVICFLVVWGWSWNTAKNSLLFSSSILLLIFSFSMTRRVMGFGSFPETNPYLKSPLIAQADLLKKTIDDISISNHKVPESIDILVIGDAPYSLKWLLRNDQPVTYEQYIVPSSNPSIMITMTNIEPQMKSSYRGQKFDWELTPSWKEMKFIDWFRWVALQSSPTSESTIYLWARNDLFPTIFFQSSERVN